MSSAACAPGPDTPIGKYSPLANWLASQAADEVHTTFAAIEDLVGPLPRCARSHSAFWSGSSARSPAHFQKKTWELAGFTVKSHDLANEAVEFRRLTGAAELGEEGARYGF
jgi:hypothetical protein